MAIEPQYETQALAALQRAVGRALDRKRLLGEYAVFWRDGAPVCIGPDAPITAEQYRAGTTTPPSAVREPHSHASEGNSQQ